MKDFGFVLSDRVVVSLSAKFPRDKTLHVKGAIFCPLKNDPPERVTLSP